MALFQHGGLKGGPRRSPRNRSRGTLALRRARDSFGAAAENSQSDSKGPGTEWNVPVQREPIAAAGSVERGRQRVERRDVNVRKQQTEQKKKQTKKQKKQKKQKQQQNEKKQNAQNAQNQNEKKRKRKAAQTKTR
ncbi:hypothetical protein CISG_05809 [Coccidioides immitis RMSCC 3703]|uniref:Uncharacterized protein n=1 Tax=Coccidioides immitis RMSCC 3703 TaxID=454286 RepID=A0A0J8QW27_COCIT|nr:hypothetical protein CISG_05809 [Coccidioides immitis RMSCC 3703]